MNSIKYFLLILALFVISLLAKQNDLDDKVGQLVELTSKHTLARFDKKKFQTYVRTAPRNYSIIVMFTALQGFRRCFACKEAHNEFEIVANSWLVSKAYGSELFFAMVDYDDAPDIFSTMQLNTAPIFIHFPKKGKNKASDTMGIERMGFSADALAKFVQDRTNIRILIIRPINYGALAIYAAIGGLIILLVYYKRQSFYNKTMWALMVIAFILTMISGQVWNQIRGAQFVHQNQQNGEVVYIHPWSDSQLVVETYIVGSIYAAIVLGMLLLNEGCLLKSTVGKKRAISVCGLSLTVFFYSLLLSVFKSKYEGYPYSLFL